MKDVNIITTIQELLAGRNEDFDHATAQKNKVQLVRQKDSRNEIIIQGQHIQGFDLYETYKHDPELFLHYASEQGSPIFDDVDYIVMFLGESNCTGRFLGVYKNNGCLQDVHYEDAPYVYDLCEVEGFNPLKERVIIDWGTAAVSWHQYYNNLKPVIRIDEGIESQEGVPYFKSYADINLSYEQLQKVIKSGDTTWRTALQSLNCIYMITDRHTGKQYVGSTYNKNTAESGIWHRWSEYAETGHGGDKTLKELLKDNPKYKYNFSWIVLETLPLNVTAKEAVKRENLYKEKFLTRLFGYNNN